MHQLDIVLSGESNTCVPWSQCVVVRCEVQPEIRAVPVVVHVITDKGVVVREEVGGQCICSTERPACIPLALKPCVSPADPSSAVQIKHSERDEIVFVFASL